MSGIIRRIIRQRVETIDETWARWCREAEQMRTLRRRTDAAQ